MTTQTKAIKYKGYIIQESKFGGYWIYPSEKDAEAGHYAIAAKPTIAEAKKRIDSIVK